MVDGEDHRGHVGEYHGNHYPAIYSTSISRQRIHDALLHGGSRYDTAAFVPAPFPLRPISFTRWSLLRGLLRDARTLAQQKQMRLWELKIAVDLYELSGGADAERAALQSISDQFPDDYDFADIDRGRELLLHPG